MKTQEKPFWEVPCNPITMLKSNRESEKSFDKNAYNKKYYENRSE